MLIKGTAKQFLAKTAACVCALSLAVALPIVPADAAVDENGDFHGWDLYNDSSSDLPSGTTVFTVETDSEKGNVIHAFRPKTDTRVSSGIIQQTFTGLTAGNKYTVSFDIKTSSFDNGYTEPLIWNAKPNESSQDEFMYGEQINTGGKWERRSETFIALAGDCDFKLLINSAFGDITDDYEVWVANIELIDADYRAPIGPSLTGWTNSISSVCTEDSSDGDGACAFIPKNTANDQGSMEYRFAPFITKPGDYTISYDIKTVSGYTYNQIMIQGTVGYLWDNATQNDIGPDAWSHFSGSFTVPEGQDVQRIVLYPQADCYIDNISIKDAGGNEYIYNGDFYNSANADGFEIPNTDYCNFIDGPDGAYLFLSPHGSVAGAAGQTNENKYILPVSVEPGKSYTLSFEAAAAGIPSRVSVHVNNISNGNGWYDIDVNAADGWVKQEIEIVPNETTQWFTFYTPDWKSAGETAYIRNISVKDSDGNEYMGDTDFLASGKPGNFIPEPDISPADVILRGDLTGDGKVDLLDLIRIKKVLSDENTEHLIQNRNANKDDSFDAGDMAILRKYLMGAVATLN